MSLNWDIRKIPDEIKWVDERDEDGVVIMEDGEPKQVMSAVTNALIWSTISVGIGTITEKNVDKFYERLSILQNLDGPFLLNRTKHYVIGKFITKKDVKDHIGLSTNVSREGDTIFRKKISRDNFRGVKNVRARLEIATLKLQAIEKLTESDSVANPEISILIQDVDRILESKTVEDLVEILGEKEAA